jgi:hypothetical protein
MIAESAQSPHVDTIAAVKAALLEMTENRMRALAPAPLAVLPADIGIADTKTTYEISNVKWNSLSGRTIVFGVFILRMIFLTVPSALVLAKAKMPARNIRGGLGTSLGDSRKMFLQIGDIQSRTRLLNTQVLRGRVKLKTFFTRSQTSAAFGIY